jgi:hypothetical protein
MLYGDIIIKICHSQKYQGPHTNGVALFCSYLQVSHVMVTALDAVWLAPKGLKQVHNMLRNVAHSLVAGGQTGVFSPMHMLVFKKPE